MMTHTKHDTTVIPTRIITEQTTKTRIIRITKYIADSNASSSTHATQIFAVSYSTPLCLNVLYIKSTRNTLDCDQSNYSSRIVFSHIRIEFGQTGISAIRSADPENPTVEPNMTWIERPLAEIWLFEIFQTWGRWSVVRALVAGRRSVGRQYILLLTLISYTPLRYVRNIAHEE